MKVVWVNAVVTAVFLLLFAAWSHAQTTFLLKSIPSNTPASDSIFVVGSFNNWNPGDPAYRLSPRKDGSFSLTLGSLRPPFEYKYTRGDWTRSESDGLGKPGPNRKQENGESPLTLVDEVFGWEDLPAIQPMAMIKVVLDEIPQNTPQDASLFITGNFNSWLPGDPELKFEKDSTGNYQVEVPVYNDTVEFKVCRGNWETVEGRKSGRARFNRRYILKEGSPREIHVKVDSWEDLSGTPINAFTIFWLMAAIQGFLIIVVINTLQRPVPRANLILSLLLSLFSVALVTRVAVYDREVFQWMPKLLLVPDFLYFLYAPLFVMYIKRLLRVSPHSFQWKDVLPFVPFVIHLFYYLPFFLMENRDFINLSVDQRLLPTFQIIGGLAFLFNLGYWIYAWRFIRDYQLESENQFSSGSNLAFLKWVMLLKAVCLLLWAAVYVVGVYGWMNGMELAHITDRITDALWIGFSFTVFLLGYFALKEPDIFRLPEQEGGTPVIPLPKENREEEETKELEIDEALKSRLESHMEAKEPYFNPKLTLPELAAQLDSSPHEVSRVINQGFGKNFNDFVNSYRVDKFKELVFSPTFENHTFLAIALHVGFNSKTAFNRSFKKLTGQTPREFNADRA